MTIDANSASLSREVSEVSFVEADSQPFNAADYWSGDAPATSVQGSVELPMLEISDDRAGNSEGRREERKNEEQKEQRPGESAEQDQLPTAPENQTTPEATEETEASEGLIPDEVERALADMLREQELGPNSEVGQILPQILAAAHEIGGAEALRELVDGINKGLEGSGKSLEMTEQDLGEVEPGVEGTGYSFTMRQDGVPEGPPLRLFIMRNMGIEV